MRRAAALCLLIGLLGGCASGEPLQEPAEGAPAEEGVTAYRLEFLGNETFTERELTRAAVDEIADLEKRGYRLAEVDDTAFQFETYYQSRGFPFARVRWEAEREGDTLVATFTIVEGPRTELGLTEFPGNQEFDPEELRAFLYTQGGWYVESRVSGAPASIRSAYQARGYLDVVVERPEVEFSVERMSADVRIRIQEGTQYRIARIGFRGNEALSSDELRGLTASFVGEPFFPRKVFEVRARIEEELANRGYATAQVRVEQRSDPETGEVVLRCSIQEGPQIEIGEIVVRGNERTNSSFIRHRIEMRSGQTYDRRKERESFRILFRTGLFQRITFLLEGEGSVRDLVIEVEEAPAREITFMPGYGSYEKLRAELGFRDRNVFGGGRIFRTTLEASMVGWSGEVGISDPWLFGSDIEVEIPAFVRRRQEPSFTHEEFGFAVLLKKHFTEPFSVTTGYQLRRSDVSSEEVVSTTEIPVEDTRVGSVTLEPRWDTRNDFFNPTQGSLNSLRFEYAGDALGSRLEFVRGELALARYWPLDDDEDWVIAGSYRTGIIQPVGETDAIPIQERFFVGGEDTVRAFEESEVGPKDSDGSPLGGEVFNVANLELRQRLGGNLWAAAFADYGNVALDTREWFDDMRWGLGLGIRYLLPVGALRVDAGYNPDRRTGEDSYEVFLSVGMAF